MTDQNTGQEAVEKHESMPEPTPEAAPPLAGQAEEPPQPKTALDRMIADAESMDKAADDLRAKAGRIRSLVAELQEHPGALEAFEAWGKDVFRLGR